MQIEALQMMPVQFHGQSRLGELTPQEIKKSFGDYLAEELETTNRLQNESSKMNAALAAGELQDVSQAIVAGQKAEIALQLTLQLRNRALSAYQELMRMQV